MAFNPLPALATAGATIDEVTTILGHVETLMTVAEDSTASGADKLTAVLNALEAAIAKAFPALNVPMAALMPQVSALISGIVSVWNALGVFTHKTAT